MGDGSTNTHRHAASCAARPTTGASPTQFGSADFASRVAATRRGCVHRVIQTSDLGRDHEHGHR